MRFSGLLVGFLIACGAHGGGGSDEERPAGAGAARSGSGGVSSAGSGSAGATSAEAGDGSTPGAKGGLGGTVQSGTGGTGGESSARMDGGFPQLDCSADNVAEYACCVFDEVNAYRANMGLPPFVYDGAVAEEASFYANYMASTGQFAHGADGKNVLVRLEDFGVVAASAGENLQRNSFTGWPEACQETVYGGGGWQNSPPHREAMLGGGKNFSHAGVGVAASAGQWWVVMTFVRY